MLHPTPVNFPLSNYFANRLEATDLVPERAYLRPSSALPTPPSQPIHPLSVLEELLCLMLSRTDLIMMHGLIVVAL